ncbi:ARM repeat-containing protein [Exidia glandulosa HHB12029]|uniref:ARM repeat-containing protein n=1 Tax=Exidia glandulosa HHB12029 TaxID=1314781 RepID=A0A165R1I5_EXIGL|nr:ARM repeat-containing protein [Exidia glandulosa HHB12029]
MDATITRGLCDKLYDKRKASALELEKVIRECHQQGDTVRITAIIEHLVEIFKAPNHALHVRNGGLIGLAATAIALGVDVAQYADRFLEPLLTCFGDAETRIRYFACESMYNICKVSKGEILVYFNPIFDALSRLAADSEASVKNGAELLDRLLKDIVAESAAVYVPQFAETEKARRHFEDEFAMGVVVPAIDGESEKKGRAGGGSTKAFSLARFMPLFSERIQVMSPFTRSFLVAWITLLDSVPDLELITFLPAILDGLLVYLADDNADVRTATENLLAEFLQEMRAVSVIQRLREQKAKARRAADLAESLRRTESDMENLPDLSTLGPERGAFLPENDDIIKSDATSPTNDGSGDNDLRDTGAWVPGQGVRIDYAAIVEILLRQLEPPQEPIRQQTALAWISALLEFAEDVMMPFSPRLIPVILSSLAHDVKAIQEAAVRTNKRLFAVIQKLPSPPVSSTLPPAGSAASSVRNITVIPSSPPAPPVTSQPLTRAAKVATPEPTQDTPSPSPEKSLSDKIAPPPSIPVAKSRANTLQSTDSVASSSTPDGAGASSSSRPESPVSSLNLPGPHPQSSAAAAAARTASPDASDPFDYQATVSALTVQFLSDHDETKVAALKWLMMLHQKAPKKILAMDDGTFPVLLKILSDGSEVVVKHDLQLLAQISSSSEEGYFRSFMENLLELFSTDRRLLDTRGSLIVRQLCTSLGAERIYRTFSDILEREEDLEFASVIVQKLNLILITAPELADCRKRLKTTDGQSFFIALYKSWCHNAVAAFALCLLAQAYEHASNLLLIFADLEITVQLLVQIDKLVQLIESPVFTYLRLQLLEPEKHPFLFKCLYGLLMTLPQSTAFVSLRNRLNAVSSMGFLHITPRAQSMPPPPGASNARSKINKEEIKWQELLNHFRAVQMKHEKARRQDFSGGQAGVDSAFSAGAFSTTGGGSEKPYSGSRPASRRKVTGESTPPTLATIPAGRPPPLALSPLNPRARGPPNMPGGLMGSAAAVQASGSTAVGRPMSPTLMHMKQKQPVTVRR